MQMGFGFDRLDKLILPIQTANTEIVVNRNLCHYVNTTRKKEKHVSKIEKFNKYVRSGYNNNARSKLFSKDMKPKILLIGDSHSADFYNILRASKIFEKLDVKGLYIPRACGNIAHEDFNLNLIALKFRNKCGVKRIGEDRSKPWLLNADTVILVSQWKEKFLPFVRNLLQKTKEETNGKAQIILVNRKHFPNPLKRKNENLKFFNYPSEIKNINSTLRNLNEPGVMFLDFEFINCKKEGSFCSNLDSNQSLLSFDGSHLSPAGVAWIASKLEKNNFFEKLLFKRIN